MAFSAYAWLLKHASTSRVATYAYVNPLIAVLLGLAGSSDGRGKGITAPNPVGQRLAVNLWFLAATQSLHVPLGGFHFVGRRVDLEAQA